MLKAIWNAVRFIFGADDAPKSTTAPARPDPKPVGNSHPIGPESAAPAVAAPAAAEVKEPAKQAPAKKAKKAAKTPAKSKSKS